MEMDGICPLTTLFVLSALPLSPTHPSPLLLCCKSIFILSASSHFFPRLSLHLLQPKLFCLYQCQMLVFPRRGAQQRGASQPASQRRPREDDDERR